MRLASSCTRGRTTSACPPEPWLTGSPPPATSSTAGQSSPRPWGPHLGLPQGRAVGGQRQGTGRRRKGARELGTPRPKPAPGMAGENLRQWPRGPRARPGEAPLSQGGQGLGRARPQRSSWEWTEGPRGAGSSEPAGKALQSVSLAGPGRSPQSLSHSAPGLPPPLTLQHADHTCWPHPGHLGEAQGVWGAPDEGPWPLLLLPQLEARKPSVRSVSGRGEIQQGPHFWRQWGGVRGFKAQKGPTNSQVSGGFREAARPQGSVLPTPPAEQASPKLRVLACKVGVLLLG